MKYKHIIVPSPFLRAVFFAYLPHPLLSMCLKSHTHYNIQTKHIVYTGRTRHCIYHMLQRDRCHDMLPSYNSWDIGEDT